MASWPLWKQSMVDTLQARCDTSCSFSQPGVLGAESTAVQVAMKVCVVCVSVPSSAVRSKGSSREGKGRQRRRRFLWYFA